MNKRTEQKEKRRLEILSAALDLFIHNGYTATKISDIAKKVNMSVGLLFHYYESKEKLYIELIKLGAQGPESVMSCPQSEPLAFFKMVAEQIFGYIKCDPFVAKMFVLMSQAQYNDATPESVKHIISQINSVEASIPIIEAGQRNKTIREGNPYALAIAYWSAIQGIAEVIALQPDSPYPESEWIVDILRRKE